MINTKQHGCRSTWWHIHILDRTDILDFGPHWISHNLASGPSWPEDESGNKHKMYQLPSGKRLQKNYGKIRHFFYGTTHQLTMAIFYVANCYSWPEGRPPFSYGFPMVFPWKKLRCRFVRCVALCLGLPDSVVLEGARACGWGSSYPGTKHLMFRVPLMMLWWFNGDLIVILCDFMVISFWYILIYNSNKWKHLMHEFFSLEECNFALYCITLGKFPSIRERRMIDESWHYLS